MSDETPSVDAGTPEPPQGTIEYDKMTDDQLDAEFAAGKGMVEEPVEQPAEPEPTPEPVAEPTEPETPAAADDAAETPEAPPEPDESTLRMQEMELRLEQETARRERSEFLMGKHAGELGHIKKLIQQAQQPQQPTEDLGYEQPAQAQTTQYPSVDPRVDQLWQSRTEDAILTAYNEFTAANPEADIPKMANVLQKEIEPYREMMAGMSPSQVRKLLGSVFKSAYADQRLADIATAREAAKTRKAEQVPKRQQAKVEASISGSGSAPTPKPQPKAVEQMTAEEADAELRKLYGSRSG